MTLRPHPSAEIHHPSPDFDSFQKAYPDYATTRTIDDLRRTEYARLDEQGHIYLDYTGGGLYADSQLQQHMDMLRRNVFGNPHSHNPTSLAMTELVDRARDYVLTFFNASAEEYVIIFTPNASGALKLVGESYPFAPGGQYVLSTDDHNSVNGIREFAHAKGAQVRYAPLTQPDLRLDEAAVEEMLNSAEGDAHNLFAFPAQSNYSGVKHPLALIETAHAKGWDVLVDFAAFAPTNPLDLSACKPDFASFSFYKMFGYPTGVGALIVRRSMLAKLQRPWFAGGTIKIASVSANGHYFAEDEAAFEDGTVNYLTLPAVEIGLRHLESIGMQTIQTRVRCLTGWLLDQLCALTHSNGRPMVEIRGPRTTEARGGTITLSFMDPDGVPLSGQRLEELAAEARISLRTGCFCNPGAGETSFGLSAEEMRRYFSQAEGMHFPELVETIYTQRGIEISAVRISVGLASNFEDVARFLDFAATLRDISAESLSRPTPNAPMRDSA